MEKEDNKDTEEMYIVASLAISQGATGVYAFQNREISHQLPNQPDHVR